MAKIRYIKMSKTKEKQNVGAASGQKRLSKTEQSIFNLMKSGKWFRSTVIQNRCSKICAPETALRRLRDLRKKDCVEAVETRRPSKKNPEWTYRLVVSS